MIAYKSTQNYGATQVQSRVASVTTTSAAISGNNITTFIFGRVTFTGVNKNKLARGSLTWAPSTLTYSWYLCEASDDRQPYEMKWYIYMTGQGSFNVTLNAYMNMGGKLTYESLL